jgi:hypothetical protein
LARLCRGSAVKTTAPSVAYELDSQAILKQTAGKGATLTIYAADGGNLSIGPSGIVGGGLGVVALPSGWSVTETAYLVPNSNYALLPFDLTGAITLGTQVGKGVDLSGLRSTL